MSQSSRMKFASLAVTLVILVCGLGSLAVVTVAAVAWGPGQQDRIRTRDACEKALAGLFRDWSLRELDRIADDSLLASRSAWAEKLARHQEAFGPITGAPRGRLVNLAAGKGSDTAEYSTTAVFAKARGQVTAEFVRRAGGPWRLTRLEIERLPDSGE